MKSSFRNSVLPKSRLKGILGRLAPYGERLRVSRPGEERHAFPESAASIAHDEVYQRNIERGTEVFKGTRRVILIGIGGSSLGTEAVYHALRTDKSPELTVLDALDGRALTEFSRILKEIRDPEELAFIVVSKSGNTTETLGNAAKALSLLEHRFGKKAQGRIAFVSDAGSGLASLARERNIRFFAIPAAIGGRYSVFTAAGMVPLSALGIDTRALRAGARRALQPAMLSEIEERAALLAHETLSGVHTVNFFTFVKRLEKLGYWYRQLLAESIGKEMTTKGASFSHQLLPIVSTAVDLHSMAQLFLSGYDGVYTYFIYTKKEAPMSIPAHWILRGLSVLKGKEVEEVNGAMVAGVLRAYDERKLPYRTTELKEVSAEEIGFFMNALMCEVMCLAHAFGVNAFNQPNVESYKRHMRAKLAKIR